MTIIKFSISVMLVMVVSGCSQERVEEFSFRKALEFNLMGLCGDEDPDCKEAVKTQTRDCMVKGDWRSYLEDEENPEQLARFTREFYACVVDADGEPYFESNLEVAE
jgi:hypothetical protein